MIVCKPMMIMFFNSPLPGILFKPLYQSSRCFFFFENLHWMVFSGEIKSGRQTCETGPNNSDFHGSMKLTLTFSKPKGHWTNSTVGILTTSMLEVVSRAFN